MQVRPMGSIYVGVNLHPFRGKSGFKSEWNVFTARPLSPGVTPDGGGCDGAGDDVVVETVCKRSARV